MIQEERIRKLVSKYGTPFYGFDADVLSKRVNYLKASLPENVELCYAAKANSFILKLLENKVTHFEICSPGEFHICKNCRYPTNKSYYPESIRIERISKKSLVIKKNFLL